MSYRRCPLCRSPNESVFPHVAAETFHHRRKTTDEVKLVDDDRKRGAQGNEGGAGLGNLAKLKFARKERPRKNHMRHQRHEKIECIGEEGQIPLPQDHLPHHPAMKYNLGELLAEPQMRSSHLSRDSPV
jgi:hypothetical protein